MPIGDTPTQLTRDAKAAIQLAFEDLGGVPRLMEWANTPGNLGTFYTQIWAKIIPKDVKAEVSSSSKITIAWEVPPPQLESTEPTRGETIIDVPAVTFMEDDGED